MRTRSVTAELLKQIYVSLGLLLKFVEQTIRKWLLSVSLYLRAVLILNYET